jgi:hypothetical protein
MTSSASNSCCSEDRKNFAAGHSLGPFERWRACSSLPFQMAMVIVDAGETNFARYYEPENPDILRVVGRTSLTFEKGHADERYARFALRTKDGRAFEREGERYEFPPLDLAGRDRRRRCGSRAGGEARARDRASRAARRGRRCRGAHGVLRAVTGAR